ncbi:MAG: phosphate-binding protein [Stygiobacter sp. RIFOXYC12_FULL_38_8]|nr:MAG: phosphate-binding protein [Stygiobacter sp. GWC2_38_9]OGU77904.1 MAG: phosphate-binding protein [Stygiobacter sp. RIFOXYA12_FULL_38_9]OGV09027.1 MAG: phosphate-binding protein [Stygiobacter sp. RIFOXYB2_FULL_37_11]OGV14157.1 MAG: phosphate-binding protein [Stygiobacter sp. RIFOXYA2_FULL_38_8]OGV16253.1 MAG: phosphate-binding protein [Stygiobacter sp. RIFOXYC2_FULL_38_25]OGV28606.1 MAG: phosphate-binding protein [Stygiobacter sp. RIFOXYC12_FULL_38_8]OGV81654.1 MAG: phosphate-binding pr
MKKIILAAITFITLFGFSLPEETITVKGSDTLVILSQRWAEVFMKSNPGIAVQVTGGGSGTGIAALLNGSTDICNASRPMKQSEIEKLKDKYGSTGVEIKVAIDGLSVYVNKANKKVNDLTLVQIKGIYTGEIKNWKEVGGSDAKIIMYGRENSSGTYVYFKEHVLENKDFSSDVQSLPGTAAVVNAVSKDKNAIGFGGAAYAKGIKDIAVKKDPDSKAFLPNKKNIESGEYPISRFLYMYTRKKPEGNIKKFVDWALSKEGQRIVAEVGYFPVKR